VAAVSRRRLLLASSAALGCAPHKGSRFPGYAFVANAGAHTVTAVDLSAFSVSRQIPLEAAPSAVVPHPSRPVVYALAPAPGIVYEIHAKSLRVSRNVRVSGPAVSLRVSADGETLWVLESKALARIPLGSMQPAGRIVLPAEAQDFDVHSAGKAAVCFRRTRVAVIADLQRMHVERTFTTGMDPALVRFQSDGRQVLVGNRGDRTLTVAETATGKIAAILQLPLEPRNFCFDPSGGQLFVSGPGMDAVVIVFPYFTPRLDQTILAGRAPGALTCSSRPRYLFVANPDTGTVTVLDIDYREFVGVINVGNEPQFLLVTPDNEYLLVLNRRSGDMAVMHIPALSRQRYRQRMVAPLFTMIPTGFDPVAAAVVAVA
jgi:DNA-binding beta-propeller fold protein YncE